MSNLHSRNRNTFIIGGTNSHQRTRSYEFTNFLFHHGIRVESQTGRNGYVPNIDLRIRDKFGYHPEVWHTHEV